MPITITAAHLVDLDVVLDVYEASFIPMVRGYHPNADDSVFDHQHLRAMWRSLLTDEKSAVFLASDTEDAIAVLALKPSSQAETLELAKLFIRPECQAAGIGKLLTLFAFDFPAEHHYTAIDLWTWEISHQSRRFYEKMGFVLTNDRGVSGYPGVDPVADITLRYERPVDPA